MSRDGHSSSEATTAATAGTESSTDPIPYYCSESKFFSRPSPDPGFPQTMHTFAIERTNPFVEIWSRDLEEKVMREARQIPHWNAVNVLRRGYSHISSECQVSIVITVKPQTIDGFVRQVIDKIWKLCNIEYGFSVNTEVIEGKFWR